MDYKYTYYENFEKLKEVDTELAEKLLEEVGEGEWMNKGLYVYPDDFEYAKYELAEGWYCDYNFNKDYNGAPNPLDYIDMDKFAKALVNSWDDSCSVEIGDIIITTDYGW